MACESRLLSQTISFFVSSPSLKNPCHLSFFLFLFFCTKIKMPHFSSTFPSPPFPQIPSTLFKEGGQGNMQRALLRGVSNARVHRAGCAAPAGSSSIARVAGVGAGVGQQRRTYYWWDSYDNLDIFKARLAYILRSEGVENPVCPHSLTLYTLLGFAHITKCRTAWLGCTGTAGHTKVHCSREGFVFQSQLLNYPATDFATLLFITMLAFFFASKLHKKKRLQTISSQNRTQPRRGWSRAERCTP